MPAWDGNPAGVLCEMLEIQDEEWRNAVEGYLNTQRFYVLVEPENFDIALGIYDRLRKEKKVYGVGLINTRDLENYDTAPAGTLASVVTSQNQYARQYSNMILGKVQMCERYEDLKKYPISITKGCMRYQNRWQAPSSQRYSGCRLSAKMPLPFSWFRQRRSTRR